MCGVGFRRLARTKEANTIIERWFRQTHIRANPGKYRGWIVAHFPESRVIIWIKTNETPGLMRLLHEIQHCRAGWFTREREGRGVYEGSPGQERERHIAWDHLRICAAVDREIGGRTLAGHHDECCRCLRCGTEIGRSDTGRLQVVAEIAPKGIIANPGHKVGCCPKARHVQRHI